MAKTAMGYNRCGPAPFPRGEAERLFPVAPALGEGPQRAQGPRQPCPRLDPQARTERARLPVCSLDALLQQRGRLAEVADGMVDLPQVQGCSCLQGAIVER